MTDTKIENKKVVGRVIKVSKEGWGFISSKEIEFTRIFFHWTALPGYDWIQGIENWNDG